MVSARPIGKYLAWRRYQLAPGHGINLPQVELTLWMEVIQWIFMREILQNVADNGKLCENVRWTLNCAKMCGKQKIVRGTGNCAISHWPDLNIACLIDTVAYRRSPHHRTIALHTALVDIFQWSGVCHGRETSLLFTLGNNANSQSSEGNAHSTAIETHWYQMCIDPHDKGSRWQRRHPDFMTSVHGIQSRYKDFVLL